MISTSRSKKLATTRGRWPGLITNENPVFCLPEKRDVQMEDKRGTELVTRRSNIGCRGEEYEFMRVQKSVSVALCPPLELPFTFPLSVVNVHIRGDTSVVVAV